MNAYLDLVDKFGAHNSNFIASHIGSELGNLLLFLMILLLLQKKRPFDYLKSVQVLKNGQVLLEG